jgi:hypothetical protein
MNTIFILLLYVKELSSRENPCHTACVAKTHLANETSTKKIKPQG